MLTFWTIEGRTWSSFAHKWNTWGSLFAPIHSWGHAWQVYQQLVKEAHTSDSQYRLVKHETTLTVVDQEVSPGKTEVPSYE